MFTADRSVPGHCERSDATQFDAVIEVRNWVALASRAMTEFSLAMTEFSISITDLTSQSRGSWLVAFYINPFKINAETALILAVKSSGTKPPP